ncbi:hypothetical protein TNCV_3150031 [Trichonephila clavipes]|nr:hypothetical protein TNCV_3150031 [Trichonephila clavipes]
MEKDPILTTVISDYIASVENVEHSPVVQHSASPNDSSRTTVMISLRDVTGLQPCPDLSPNQLALGIPFSTKTTLIRKEDRILLMRCPVFVLLTPF